MILYIYLKIFLNKYIMESEKLCIICGEEKNKHFIHKLDCGHEFHYECIIKCFNSCKKDMRCPFCRSDQKNKKLHSLFSQTLHFSLPQKKSLIV